MPVINNNNVTCGTGRATTEVCSKLLSLPPVRPSVLVRLITEQLGPRTLVAASTACDRLAAETLQPRHAARHEHYSAALPPSSRPASLPCSLQDYS